MPTVVVWVGQSSVFMYPPIRLSVGLYVFPQGISKTDAARITIFDILVVHHESWKLFYVGVKGQGHVAQKTRLCQSSEGTQYQCLLLIFSFAMADVADCRFSTYGVFRSHKVLAWVMALLGGQVSLVVNESIFMCVCMQAWTLTVVSRTRRLSRLMLHREPAALAVVVVVCHDHIRHPTLPR